MKPRPLLLALFGILAVGLLAEPVRVERFHLNEASEKQIGYCQAVRVGNLLYISGSVGSGEMKQAVRQAMETLATTLRARGLSFKNVVKENVYATDLDAFIQNADVRRGYYGETLPAATWVGVKRLFLPEFSVEIEVVAVFPE
jgi:2-iminobutanoate/2-iminopropanoate deaminase